MVARHEPWLTPEPVWVLRGCRLGVGVTVDNRELFASVTAGDQIVQGADSPAGRGFKSGWVDGVDGGRARGGGQLGGDAKSKAAVLTVGLANGGRVSRELVGKRCWSHASKVQEMPEEYLACCGRKRLFRERSFRRFAVFSGNLLMWTS